MGATLLMVLVVLPLGFLDSALGFLQMQPPGAVSEGTLQNVSLRHLSSEYLKRLYSDTTLLRIWKSKLGVLDKDAFDHLSHLNLLEISDSEIQEPLDPQTFARLPGLEILVLRNVGLRQVHLNLTNVQKLVLAENEMEGIDGRAVRGRNVNFLDLSGNKLRELEGSFADMRKLSVVDLSRNKIRAVPPVFSENGNLRSIMAAENEITRTEGLRLPGLKTLDLFANKIGALAAESFFKMAALEDLVLALNEIQHVDVDAFKDMVELRYLNLAWNRIEDLSPDLFRRNLYLTRLSLQGNKLRSLEKLRSVHHHLTHLDLSHNHLSLLDPQFFRSTPALQVLDLGFNRLKFLGDTLSPLPELMILNLAYNNIDMTGTELSSNRHLTRLNLSSNGLEGGLTHFENNPRLSELDLSDNKISVFCDGNASLRNLLKLNLRGNQIKSLTCLKDLESLCQVDIRHNLLSCGQELDLLISDMASRKTAPFDLVPEFQGTSHRSGTLSLNRSLSLWNSVKRELCPGGRDIELDLGKEEEEEAREGGTGDESAAESLEAGEREVTSKETPKKTFVVVPLGWIRHDEMNKPNPLQNPQSGRESWWTIEENSELLGGFEDDEVERKPRFSWYSIALILIGLSLTLTCFNLVVFLYIRLKVWKRADSGSPQKYTFLHNEVYRNTTEPSKVPREGEGEWAGAGAGANEKKNKVLAYGKINEVLLNFSLGKREKDPESDKNVLISPSGSPPNLL